MTELNEIYKCEICGNIVEMTHSGKGELVCCGQPMKKMEEQAEGEYGKKHAPVLEKNENKTKIKIGKIWHPMEAEHYIEWIEIFTKNNEVFRKYLNANMEHAETTFNVKKEDIAKTRMYCNIHGLWIS